MVADGLAVAPDNPHLHCLRGRLELEAGNAAQAKAAVDRALTADPKLAEGWALRGVLRYQEGDAAGALEALSRALELKPSPAIHFNRGTVYQEAEQWEAAIADFTAALDLDADDPDTWLRRGTCRARIGQAEGSEEDLRRAGELTQAG